MKRSTAFLMCAFACVAANADELGTGVKAWEQRDFATAHTILSKLASAGDPQAMLLLGEMVGYGEGVPDDLARAESLLGKAAAAGKKEAVVSLANVRNRAARKADIASVLNNAAAPQSLAAFGCAAPAFPVASTTRQDIKAVAASAGQWRDCYGRYGAYLNSLPAGDKALPADVAKLMNLVELEQVRTSREQAVAHAAAAASADAALFAVNYDRWFAHTVVSVKNIQDFALSQLLRRETEARDIAEAGRRARDATLANR